MRDGLPVYVLLGGRWGRLPPGIKVDRLEGLTEAERAVRTTGPRLTWWQEGAGWQTTDSIYFDPGQVPEYLPPLSEGSKQKGAPDHYDRLIPFFERAFPSDPPRDIDIESPHGMRLALKTLREKNSSCAMGDADTVRKHFRRWVRDQKNRPSTE
jgi:hypothetical protein